MTPVSGPNRRAVVITCSDRAAAGRYPDRSGPFLVDALREAGWDCEPPIVVPDGDNVAEALALALADAPAVILTTGGTGLGPRDLTPEVTAPLLRRQLPGVAEAIRAAGVAAGVPSAMLSRGLAGVADLDSLDATYRATGDAGHRAGGRTSTLVVNLPGSLGGCRDGWAVLAPVLPHAIDQLAGGGH